MPSVCAITVTYGERFESLCKGTIERALEAGVDHVVLVDNGSDHSSAAALRSFCAENAAIETIRCQFNEGSAVGFGLGLTTASSRAFDFVWLLDDDNWVETNTLTKLINVHAIAANRYGDPLTVVCAARHPNAFHQRVREGTAVQKVYPPIGAFMNFDALRYVTRRLGKPTQLSDPLQVIPYAPYGGLLIPRGVLKEIGLPSAKLLLYSDDTHWTSNIARRGHRIVLATDVLISDAEAKWSTVIGSNSVTAMVQKRNPERLYLSTRNRVWLDHRNLRSSSQRIRYACNRAIVMTVAWVAAVRSRSSFNYRLFRRAIRHAEAGDLSQNPQLVGRD